MSKKVGLEDSTHPPSTIDSTEFRMAMRDLASGAFRWAAGTVVPMFARPVAPVALAWFVHVVLVIAIAVGLYFAQPHLHITEVIQKGPLGFRPFWLPALFLLIYALTWSAAWLWQLLSPGQPITDFPDIDVAWDEIVAALQKAGIGIADTPIFLVFGEFPSGLEALFRSLPNGLTVAGGSTTGSPIRAFRQSRRHLPRRPRREFARDPGLDRRK